MVRGLGSVGNPSFGNLNIAKGCDRMVERSWGHMGHIDEMFREIIVDAKKSRKYFLCARNFLEKFSLGKSMHAIQIFSINKIKIRLLIPSNSTGSENQ